MSIQHPYSTNLEEKRTAMKKNKHQ